MKQNPSVSVSRGRLEKSDFYGVKVPVLVVIKVYFHNYLRRNPAKLDFNLLETDYCNFCSSLFSSKIGLSTCRSMDRTVTQLYCS